MYDFDVVSGPSSAPPKTEPPVIVPPEPVAPHAPESSPGKSADASSDGGTAS